MSIQRSAVWTRWSYHNKIDPLGFALENFDVAGGLRSQYSKEAAIDPCGQLPRGEAFTSFNEFRPLMKQRHEPFTRSLAGKLLTYALGHEIGIFDRTVVDSII